MDCDINLFRVVLFLRSKAQTKEERRIALLYIFLHLKHQNNFDVSCSTETKGAKSDQVVYGQSKLDSHADAIALGKYSIIMGYTMREYEVSAVYHVALTLLEVAP